LENKKYYFFSDAHLGLKSKEEEKAKEETEEEVKPEKKAVPETGASETPST
jgi:hypothetical protein